jgi:bifunctional DNase/RNase
MNTEDMLPIEVAQLFLSNIGFVILLDSDEDARSLPIFIGAAEAQSIARFINNIDTPRPLTHDLFKNMLDFFECRVMRAEICDIKDGTFYARLVMDYDGSPVEMDCRPSDAIAIALRCDVPIYAARHVIEKAGHVFSDEELAHAPRADISHSNPYHPPPDQKHVHKKSPLDLLKQRQKRAVAEERYEDAARIRDEIKRLNNTHTEN